MSSGSRLTAVQDKLLGNISTAYVPDGYISEMILPAIYSKNKTGKIGVYGTEHLRIVNSNKIGKGKYKSVDSTAYSTTGYDIEGHGLTDLVTKEDYANVYEPFKAEEDKVMGLSSMLWLEKEKVVADALGNTSIITQNVTLAGVQQYNDYTNSTPVQDFSTARAAVKAGCGMVPNLAIMSWEVKNKLKYHPQLADYLGIKYNQIGPLSDEQLAMALDVDKVLVGKVSYESAKEGQASSLAPVWGKNIIFAVSPQKAALHQVALGYMVRYEGEQPRKVYKWAENNPPESTSVLVEDNYDQLLTNVKAAYLVKNAIA